MFWNIKKEPDIPFPPLLALIMKVWAKLPEINPPLLDSEVKPLIDVILYYFTITKSLLSTLTSLRGPSLINIQYVG